MNKILLIIAFAFCLFSSNAQDAAITKADFDNIDLSYPGLEKVHQLVG